MLASLEPPPSDMLLTKAKLARQDSIERFENALGEESKEEEGTKDGVSESRTHHDCKSCDPEVTAVEEGIVDKGGSMTSQGSRPSGTTSEPFTVSGPVPLAKYFGSIRSMLWNQGVNDQGKAKISTEDEDVLSDDEAGGAVIDRPGRDWQLSPNTRIVRICTLSMLLVMLVFVFYLPIRMAFYSAERGAWSAVDIIFSLIFLTDIILKLNTGFIDSQRGEVCYDRRRILLRYASGMLIVDFLAMFPLTLVPGLDPGSPDGRHELAYLIKVPKLCHLYSLMNNVQSWNRIDEGPFVALRTFLSVVVTTHVLGCGWYMLATLTHLNCEFELDDDFIQGECPWIYRYGYADLTLGRQFLGSVYWSLTTLTTVGYGDISARTAEEQIYSMAVQIVGVSWYGYIVGSWATVLNGFDSADKALRSKMREVVAFTKDKGLSTELAKTVRHHFRYMYRNDKWVSYDGDEILADLPPGLRAQVVCRVEKDKIEMIPWLKDKDDVFVADLVVLLKGRHYEAKDILHRKGQQPEELLFIVHGKVDLMYKNQRVSSVREGGMVGLVGLMGGQDHKLTARANTEVDAYALRRVNFWKIVSAFPQYSDELMLETKKSVREVEKSSREARAQMESSPVLAELLLPAERLTFAKNSYNNSTGSPGLAPSEQDGGAVQSAVDTNSVGWGFSLHGVAGESGVVGPALGSGPMPSTGLEEVVDRAVGRALGRTISSLELSIRESIDLGFQRVSPLMIPSASSALLPPVVEPSGGVPPWGGKDSTAVE